IDVQRLAEAHDVAVRAVSTYRMVMMTPPERRTEVLAQRHRLPSLTAEVQSEPPVIDPVEGGLYGLRLLRVSMNLVPLMGVPHWRELRLAALPDRRLIAIGMMMPDGDWLNLTIPVEPLSAWLSPTFLAAFLLMTVAAAGLTLWAVRRLTAPVR